MANFRVAASRRYTTRDGEQREQTEWFRVVCWRRLAEIAGQYLQKGRQVYIEGRLETRQWEDRDGNTRYTTEVVANEMVMLGSRGGGGGGGGGDWDDGPSEFGGGPDAGDLPFE